MSDPDCRRLPPVHAVLVDPRLVELAATKGRTAIVQAVRTTMEATRQAILDGQRPAVDIETLARLAGDLLESERPSLRPVINATGILLNTGLGRAPLAEEAANAVDQVVRGYCNLEIDLDSGERGHRTSGVEALLTRLTGAEAATVVNNNAGATILAVRALAAGREVIVSRGQLVEIGGSFRLPEIIEVSGARLRRSRHDQQDEALRLREGHRPGDRRVTPRSPEQLQGRRLHRGGPDRRPRRLAVERDLWMIDDIGSGALARRDSASCPR